MTGPLDTVCACGHKACFHPSTEHQAARIKASDGRYPGECKGGTVSHCRCITDRSQVIASGLFADEAVTR